MTEVAAERRENLVHPVAAWESRRGFVSRTRFEKVATALALGCATIVLLLITQPEEDEHTKRIETLATLLCCEGCCRGMIPAAGSGAGSQTPSTQQGTLRARATVLHFAGQSEIDYTASGHRVSQHMESAVKELTSLEDHVKSGMPKYLRESAVQRERDLVNHRFAARDLTGSSKAKQVSATRVQHVSERQAEPQQAVAAVHPETKKDQKIDDQLVQAEQMDAHLKNREENEMRAIVSPATKELSQGLQGAEKEADNAYKRYSKQKSPQPPHHFGLSSEQQQESQSLHAVSKGLKQSLSKAQPAAKVQALSPVPHREAHDTRRAALHIQAQARAAIKAGDFVPITSSGLPVAGSSSDLDPLHPATQQQQQDEAVVIRLADRSYSLGSKEPSENLNQKVRPSSPSPKSARVATSKHSLDRVMKQRNKVVEGKSTSTTAVKGAQEQRRLSGVLSHISTIIGGYTGGANTHSSFLKHFDQMRQKGSSAQLGAETSTAQLNAKRPPASREQTAQLSAAMKLQTGHQPRQAKSSEARQPQSRLRSTAQHRLKSNSAREGNQETHSELWQLTRKQSLASMRDASTDLAEVMNRKRQRLSPSQVQSVLGLKMHLRR